MKEEQRKIKNMFLLYLEKFLFGLLGHFGLENDASSELWIGSKDFLKIFQNEKGQAVCENYINGFSQKIFIRATWSFWAQN